MKILSHELQTETHYSFSQELLSAKTSFLSFLAPDEQEAKDETNRVDLKPNELEKSKYQTYDRPRTLFSIIESLLQALNERVNAEVQSIEKTQKPKQGFRSQLSLYERYEEKESYSFSTKGCIKTDCKDISIDIDFSLSRSFVIENRINIANSFDPLVINFKGEIPELEEKRFSFDLDNDGEEDQISSLKEGNGFLALDRNEDGKVNEGSELFGTRLGNGFTELSEYDCDKNAWIDENDAIFSKLRIWSKNGCEGKELLSLGEVGIGAIYLGAAEADFSYKTPKNERLGELRSSGIFLYENGQAGNISQIDFDLGKAANAQNMDTPLGKLLQA